MKGEHIKIGKFASTLIWCSKTNIVSTEFYTLLDLVKRLHFMQHMWPAARNRIVSKEHMS